MKKLAAMLLTSVMLAGCMVGCGQEEVVQEGQSAKDSQEQTVSSDVKEVVEEEPVTVKWVLRTDAQEDDPIVLEELNKLLKEKINVQLELIPISGGEYDTRTQLMSTSGEDYDLIWTSNWSNSFVDNMNREAFMPLDDLLASDAGEMLREAVPEWLYGAATIDGKIYAVPNNQIMAYQVGVVIQKEYADKYNLDVGSIETIRDLEPFLEQIRDNEPDLIPMCETDSIDSALREISTSWVTNSGLLCVLMDDETCTVKTRFEVRKEDILNEYYHKGFIRSDFATVTDNTADLAANKYVCRCTQYSPSCAANESAKYGKEYIAIPITDAYIPTSAGITTMNAININSKNPEAAIKLLGLFYSDVEVYNMFMYGLEGQHYNKVSDTRIEPIKDSGYSRADIGWEYGNLFNAWLIPGNADDVWEETERMNNESVVSNLLGFTFSTANVQTEIAQLSAVRDEYAKKIVVADDFESAYAEFEKACIEAGLDVVKEELQSQLDAWREANNK